MKTFPLVAVFSLCLLLSSRPLFAQIDSNQGKMPPDAIATGGPAAAQAAGDVWLGLLDDGQYAQCWQTSASLFQKAVPKDQWTNLATSRRAPLGKMLARKLTSANFTPTLPGTPTGKYVVAQYESSFERKKTAVETVTAMLDTDGQWRVLGYYVR